VGGLLDRLVGVFGRANVYVELQRHLQRDETYDNEMLVSLAEAFRVPILATNGVRFAAAAERPLHDVLTCIREHTTLAQAGRRLLANAERYLKSPAQMARLFEDLPRAVHATRELADRLEFTMQDLGYRFPRYPVPPGETEASFLRKIADIGARERYRPYHDKARAQIERELNLIEKLELAGYFLIVWDIVNFCRQHDILVQGRGSAANSAVCYSLGITAVDPVGMELLFERFLSEERGEWPDIDLDLPSGDRREQVIQHVYAKYGQHGAAMTANVISYRGKSAAREVGKALNLDPTHIDRLAKVMHNFEFKDADDSLTRNLQTAGVDAQQPQVVHFAKLWQQMQDLPRHLGQHSGGMVICQGALSSVVPLENASMPGRVVVQWDKEDCADMGLIKVDLLGLGMMSALQDALAIINTSRDQGPGTRDQENDADDVMRAPDPQSLVPSPYAKRPLDMANMPPNDPAVYAMLQAADTVGLFQVESRAQMATLPRLKPACFYDLVVQVAIIRPGPIVGQMVHPYLDRRAGREAVVYDHPLLEPVLKRTLGVPLFQEQVMKLAEVAAGFTPGEADQLRRAMAAWKRRGGMERFDRKLLDGMRERGYAEEFAHRILAQIRGFSDYGFPEAHAASFALLAWVSAWLKQHHPAAFTAALLNSQPMGFYGPAQLLRDARAHGVVVRPVDVLVSEDDCTLEPDGEGRPALRLGLRCVHGLAVAARERIVAARCVASFVSLTDLGDRAALARHDLEALAAAGALAGFDGHRHLAFWRVAGYLPPLPAAPDAVREGTQPLLRAPTEVEDIFADYRALGFTLGRHPLALLRERLGREHVLASGQLDEVANGAAVRVAGLVTARQRPATASGVTFVTLEDECGQVNVLVWRALGERQNSVLVNAKLMEVRGELQRESGVTHVIAHALADRTSLIGALRFGSHDFH
jgi:error-prone DNA polymerase